jgi:uncharacterized membrane protein YcaP (DUF421 family)
VKNVFLASWSDLGRILAVGTLAYVCLVLILRISGKRTLTKLNAFDLVVTVALGSTLATIMLNKSVALAEGVLALALLILLQFAITWASVRSETFQTFVKAQPVLLVYRGAFLEEPMRRERVTREETLAVIRNSGVSDIADVAAVVLETDGSFSVLSSIEEGGALATVVGVRKIAAEKPQQAL